MGQPEGSSEVTDGEVPEVADILEQLRLAEAKLTRQRQQRSEMNDTDRSAMRYLLERVDTQEVTPTMIARALNLSPAAGTALMDRLVGRGMIDIEPHGRDRRKKLVRPFDRNMDPDQLDPLTTRLRALAAELTDIEARTVGSFLNKVLAAVAAASPQAAR
ncbi:MAG TPA: MarR family transcriptional regulator [Microbacterium sp.]|nr:MarR family transcriptional regulator [Microbacterium sp.]